MDPAIASIIVAVIGAVGGLVGVAIKEFRSMKESNSQDHGNVMKRLDGVQQSVEKVADRLDEHIDWHLKK